MVPSFSPESDDALDAAFTALADPTRRRIVDRLAHGPATVGELVEPFAISQPAISKHLRILERAGIVRRVRDGRFQRCSLDPRPIESAIDFMARYRTFWNTTLDQFADYVESDSTSAGEDDR